MKQLRSLVCSIIGHVDHGKSQIVETITNLKIIEKEAGKITQCISCIQIPADLIKDICQTCPQIEHLKIPGLLLIDTPGHASFTNLRKRGGSLADIAILVIDINEGLKPQTLECLEILKNNKTPFIIAANKIDLIPGFQNKDPHLLENLNSQSETVQKSLNDKLYTLVGKLTEHNFDAERFDKIQDYAKKIAIVPLSAKANIGIPELLLVLTGLAQKFLEAQLEVDLKKPAKGVILEIKEEKGLGKTLDTIIYDGKLKKEDAITIAGLEKPLTTKIRNLCFLSPQTKKLTPTKEVEAACTIKIVPASPEDIFAGMPFQVSTPSTREKIEKDIQAEVEEVLIETEKEGEGGVIVKADSLGSLEALISLLKEHKIKIKKASLGNINKTDIAEASAESNPIYKAILAFNVKSELELETKKGKQKEKEKVKTINHNVIYQIIEDYKDWEVKETKKTEQEKLKGTIRPGKIVILPGTVFRQNNPAIVGVEVLQGSISTDTPLMKDDGTPLTTIKSIQVEGENTEKLEKGKQAAISLPKVTVGRQIFENFTLFTDIPEKDFRKLKEMKKYLNPDEVALLREIALIKRKQNPLWGV